jgi:hypothetical protein
MIGSHCQQSLFLYSWLHARFRDASIKSVARFVGRLPWNANVPGDGVQATLPRATTPPQQYGRRSLHPRLQAGGSTANSSGIASAATGSQRHIRSKPTSIQHQRRHLRERERGRERERERERQREREREHGSITEVNSNGSLSVQMSSH